MIGCEFENIYYVSACGLNGENMKKVPLFKCKEKSDCFSRNFLSADCRPFKMEVFHHTDDNHGNDNSVLKYINFDIDIDINLDIDIEIDNIIGLIIAGIDFGKRILIHLSLLQSTGAKNIFGGE